MSKSGTFAAALFVCALLAFAPPVLADLFGYKDAEGNYHIVSDPSQIPEQYRSGATRKSNAASAPPAPSSPDGAAGEGGGGAGPEPGPTAPEKATEFSLPSLDPQSGQIVLDAVLNGSTRQRMVVDTGASITGIPLSAAARLGLSIRPPMTTVVVQTASGLEVFPVVRLQAVEVGGAKVEDLPVLLNQNLPGIGLLGVDFLSAFHYSVDSTTHTLKLTPLDTKPRPGFYGGRPEGWWRDRFSSVQGTLQRLRQARSELVSQTGGRDQGAKLSGGPFEGASAKDLLSQLDMSIRFWEIEHQKLERKASEVEVPYGLR